MAMKDYNGSNFKNVAIDRLTGKFGKGDDPKSNRGDRMVARGEKKIAKADSKIEKRVMVAEEKASEKVRKLSNKFGDAPKYNQAKRLDNAESKLNTASKQTDKFIDKKNDSKNPGRKYNVQDSKDAVYNEYSTYGQKNVVLKDKFRKGQKLVKKGEMLSKHIKSKN